MSKEISMKEGKPYPVFEEEDGSCMKASEPVVALAEPDILALPDDVDYAHIVDGILQITPDIEEEITATDRGETVSMSEFKSMFARWLWQ